ncbi:hypothetical protein VE03_09309 [Pseudogymnoascus sp. 23342-1-I1]|nr:hypothetical protein VE03_09309 [Pseudogymnoascus sp. 23342-1-I1]
MPSRDLASGESSVVLPLGNQRHPISLQFSQAQLCFASTIRRSLPKGMTIEEFIHQVSNCIKSRKPVPGEPSTVNSVAFWRNHYTELLRYTEALEADAERWNNPEASGNGVNNGRHNADTLHLHHVNDGSELASGSNEAPSPPLPCTGLIRSVRVLHDHVSNPTVPAPILRGALKVVIYKLRRVLEATPLDGENYFGLDNTFRTAASGFSICLQGLSHLCRDIPGRLCKDGVISSLIKLFKTAMWQNTQLCVALATTETARRETASSPDPLSLSPREPLVKAPHLLQARTRYLACMITSPAYNMKEGAHVDLIEGLLSVFLTRLGRLLSMSVFQEQISASNIAGGISAVPATAERGETDQIALRLECEQMKSLLRRVTVTSLSDEPELYGNGTRHLAELIKGRRMHPGIGVDNQLGKARRRLQDTLLRGVFGEDGGKFAHALKTPEWEDDLEEEDSTVDETNSEFVDMLWNLIGWESLDTAM